MSLARNLSKFKPSSSGLVETADIADDAVTSGKIEHNPAIVGNIEPTGSVRVDDGQYFQAGNSYDLQMYHDGANSYIEDQGTGDLILKGTAVRLRTDNLVISNTANNEDMITASADGAVNLRHNNVSCLTTTSDGGITVNGGNIVIGTAGKGIDFSAVSHASGMSSELLDSYEEGTFSPSADSFSGTMTFTTARYTKIGKLVHVNFKMTSDGNGDTDQISISGFPFSAVAEHPVSMSHDMAGNGALQSNTTPTIPNGMINTAEILYVYLPTGGAFQYAFMGSGFIRVSGTYITA